ncbi:MFS general substrate transporter [Dendrothele bispora CBS 962.96]|uniref:MFS general substrate transporter n=1 Tax=Dendrothele bispora (strain CBS 962.96) TaxID=1314807 RepID=A0A4S8MSZ3_DENBC|nr:MFS general substrate transporter [Dendrothele bispora CBS 962.96]
MSVSTESTLRSTSAPHELDLNHAEKLTPQQHGDSTPSDTMPEGGVAAWLTVTGSFIIQFCAFGYSTSFGVYQDFYTREYLTNESSSTISWIGSVNTFLVLGSGIIVGRLFDRGYFYWLLWGGSILTSFSLFMLSLAKPNQFYQIFLSQGLGAGLGSGILYVPSIAIVSQYFRERRALAMTIVSSGSSLGAFLHPLMLNKTINGSLGFANGTRANAGLISGLLLVSCLIMRTRLPPPTHVPELGRAIRGIVRDYAFIFASVGLLIFAIGYYFPLFYLQLDATTRGLDPTFAFYTLVIMNASSFIGRLTPGVLSQYKVPVGNMFAISSGGCAVLIFGMIGIKTDAAFVIFGIIYGFFAGMFVALLGPILSLLTEDIKELGARMGVAYLFTAIGGLLGGPINGALLTGNLVWWRPAVFSGVVTTVATVFFCAMLVVLHLKKRTTPSSSRLTASPTPMEPIEQSHRSQQSTLRKDSYTINGLLPVFWFQF